MKKLLVVAVIVVGAVILWRLFSTPPTKVAPTGATHTAASSEIFTAAKAGDLEKVKALLEANPQSVNEKGDQDETPLYLAAAYGHAAVVKLLLNHNANVNAVDKNAGWTPLHRAANAAVAELLLNHNADVNATPTESRVTPLHLAAMSGRTDVVELLLKHNANVNAVTVAGITPLLWAALYGHTAVAELLLKHGANVNVADRHGMTPLHAAAAKGHTAIVKLLLNYRANVNARDLKGKTPLSYANQSLKRVTSPEERRLLITPLSYADLKETADLLRKWGGKE